MKTWSQSCQFVFVFVGSVSCLTLLVLQSQIVYELVRVGRQDANIRDRVVVSVVNDATDGLQIKAIINVSTVSLEDFRRGAKTGNPLIDEYGENDPRIAGEMGWGIALTDEQNDEVTKIVDKFKVNNLVSDVVPLNRIVPDSRLPGCSKIKYNISSIDRVSVIIPFYDEWPSLILRTVYSIINRTPRSLLRDIILVDDNSTIDQVKGPLDRYISDHFPRGLVKIIRMPKRKGLSSARMAGVGEAKGEVLVFFDSHMEVNIDWLPPLLAAISKNRRVVAMSHLDYIRWDTFEYHFDRFWMVKYGWDWALRFFETYFRPDEVGRQETDARPGTTMVGAAFAMDKKYFIDLGGYDTQMSIWGGENLEMTWRLTLCGGKLLHLPCSKIGHVARAQPYSFPGGRGNQELYNLKRAVDVWMGNYSRFVYKQRPKMKLTLCGGKLLHLPCSKIGHVARAQPYSFPGGRGNQELYNLKRAVDVWMGNYSRFVYKQRPKMKDVDAGDLSERIALRDRLGCKDFGWYLKNVWPELHVYDKDVVHWGQVANEASEKCLDNNNYIFQAREKLYLKPCHDVKLQTQGFSLTTKGRLRTTLQCVVTTGTEPASKVILEDCLIGASDTWRYDGVHLIHVPSDLCMEVTTEVPILRPCEDKKGAQKWMFVPIPLS